MVPSEGAWALYLGAAAGSQTPCEILEFLMEALVRSGAAQSA